MRPQGSPPALLLGRVPWAGMKPGRRRLGAEKLSLCWLLRYSQRRGLHHGSPSCGLQERTEKAPGSGRALHPALPPGSLILASAAAGTIEMLACGSG